MNTFNLSQVLLIRNTSDSTLIEVALRLAAADFDMFEKLLKGDNLEVCVSGRTLLITDEQIRKLRAVGNCGDVKIPTIKLAREMLSLGLKEAKDLVEVLSDACILNGMNSFGLSDSCCVEVVHQPISL